MIQPLSIPNGLIFYIEYTYGKQLDKRTEAILREAGVKIWKERKG